ncbi:Dipeptidylpeptidase IV, N-terminal domain,Peptidase S9, prolyl oligopeptidase, catalytic [Cinara cedri]|uniref:Venom dipeptidyl peptidase 4 n=1 Tax=Cinara cedri TaxID=506608 RepID=A0A5E4N2L2_9HEMI|nr:Dipeptidylpeptidase IV, N-terminal domain,Peptidase S9, prolyl oligopeptidase, catalytic [Cinara cedri]
MEYVLWKMKNCFIMTWLAFCFIVSTITLIVYFTIDVDEISEHGVRKHGRIMFKTLLNDNQKYFDATWVSDDEILAQDDDGNIILYDVNKSIKSVLAFNSMQHVKDCGIYELSADRKYLLIGYNFSKNAYQHIHTRNYDVINIKTGKQVTLRDTLHKPRDVMHAEWSPTDSSLAIVDGYNIFYIPTVAKPNHAKQLTFHGSKDFYNGIPDWVYKEEIFRSNRAMWFSGRGTKLAYATFNETLVPTVYLQYYGIPDTMYDQYSRLFNYHYPKVNDPNPTVELFVQSLNIKNDPAPAISIKPVNTYTNETILDTVIWSGDEHLYVMWMNRIQNESHLVHYYISNNSVEVRETMEFLQENGWLNFRRSILIDSEQQVALVYPTEQTNGDSYGHVTVIQTNGEMKTLTDGKFEVTKLVKWNSETNYIYYLANVEGGPEKQHLYRVLVNFECGQQNQPECLTCDTGCNFNEATFSEKNTYLAHICMGPSIPYVNIMKTDGENIAAWETNKNVYRQLENVTLPRVLFLTIPLVDGFEASVKLLIPPGLDVSPGKKYPLIINSYGGPMVNVALDKFQIDLDMYLSVNHNIIVACIDGRGTELRGTDTLFENYKKLGTGEIDDQIIVAKYLQKTLSYVDSDRTGIYGWSYGGYVAGMALAKDNEHVFKCAVSIAPVTDWIYYDSIYTERLMGMYTENFEGYRNSSLIENATNLRHKKYMLIHGLFDNNVHFQHSVMLSKELQHLGITFSQQFYPDESHSFSSNRNHLYRTIIDYILNCLK